MMSIYIHDAGILDVFYIVHAVPVDPCSDHFDGAYSIGLILDVGNAGFRSTLTYATRAARDEAFEQICALKRQSMRAMQDALDEEDEA